MLGGYEDPRDRRPLLKEEIENYISLSKSMPVDDELDENERIAFERTRPTRSLPWTSGAEYSAFK